MNADPASLHVSVLPDEVLEYLAPKAGGRYLDGTLGMGGHALSILNMTSKLGSPAELCGLDRDQKALSLAEIRLAEYRNNTHMFHLKYSQFGEALDELGWNTIDGALLDIGVSSLQIDSPERGFSFHADGPLDMRMNQSHLGSEEPVSRFVNRARLEELRDVISKYGEEPQAGRIAAAIVRERQVRPFETTKQLADVVVQAYPPAWRAKARNHPATRTFQALRMAVNDELGELERFLDAILARLAVGGRLVIISFHSLEDRVVKHKLRDWAQGCVCPKYLPRCVCNHEPEIKILTPRPITASDAELARNPRASSAKLRAAEKLPSNGIALEISPSFERDRRPSSRRERLKMREDKMRRRGFGG